MVCKCPNWPFPNETFADTFAFAMRACEGLIMLLSLLSARMHRSEAGDRNAPVAGFHMRHAAFTFTYTIPRVVLILATGDLITPKSSHNLPGDCAWQWRLYNVFNYLNLLAVLTFFTCEHDSLPRPLFMIGFDFMLEPASLTCSFVTLFFPSFTFLFLRRS